MTRSESNQHQLRRALGAYPTGVTVVTTSYDGRLVGLTANSFTSISLDPPVVLWSLRLASPSYPIFSSTPAFCINVLSEGQSDLSRRFATPIPDKFNGVKFDEGLHGVPILRNVAAHFECTRSGEYGEGDHVIFLGAVQRYEARQQLRPLVFHRGQYRAIQENEEARV